MPQALPPGKSGVSAIFPATKHQERGPDNRHHASFCFLAGNPIGKHDICRMWSQRQESFPCLPGRPSLYTRPSLCLSLSSFPSAALENNAHCSIPNDRQWYTFILLSSPFLDYYALPFYVITAIILLYCSFFLFGLTSSPELFYREVKAVLQPPRPCLPVTSENLPPAESIFVSALSLCRPSASCLR